MRTAVVRYGEIGSKSPPVRGEMLKILRQRVEDRLEYEDIEYSSVSKISGRIVVENTEAKKAAKTVSDLPGIASCSPAYETGVSIDTIKSEVEKLEIGDSFGVETNRAGKHEFTSQDVNHEIGSHIEELTGSRVDLENPETWVRIDIRNDRAFVYTEVLEGPDGFPVGSQGKLVSLISGGIDSPVASYKAMTRGIDILPIYFYNKPIAAEDHLLRFQAALKQLEKYHPSKKWEYYVVDMEQVNEELMKIDSGRMVLHRRIMFQVAEKITEKEGLNGIVTGESLGQKSSQTSINMERTTEVVDKPVHRPLLTEAKSDITQKAREIDTLKESNIKSACSTLSPENPATELKKDQLEQLEKRVDIEELVKVAVENAEKNRL